MSGKAVFIGFGYALRFFLFALSIRARFFLWSDRCFLRSCITFVCKGINYYDQGIYYREDHREEKGGYKFHAAKQQECEKSDIIADSMYQSCNGSGKGTRDIQRASERENE